MDPTASDADLIAATRGHGPGMGSPAANGQLTSLPGGFRA
jgi:hypothetical protein